MAKDIILTRQFVTDLDLKPSVFKDNQNIVNFFIEDLRNNSQIFLPEDFENKGNTSVKSLYNKYKKYLNNNNRVIPYPGYLERVYRCNFQYAYFAIRNYHKRRELLFSVGKRLLPHPWWEDWDSISKIISKKKLNVLETSNVVRQYRRLLQNIIKDRKFLDTTQIKMDFIEFTKIYEPDLDEKTYKKLLTGFKQRVGKILKKSLNNLKKNPDKQGWGEVLVSKISSDFTQWQRDKKIWWKSKNEELKNVSRENLLNNFSFTDSIPEFDEIVNRLFFPRKARGRVTSASIAGFEEYIRSYLNAQCKYAFIAWLGKKYHNKIKKMENELVNSFSQYYPDTLKLPEFRSNSIPFGMDDGRIYKIDDTVHSFKLLKGTDFESVSFDNDERYTSLIDTGWTPKRGVLRLSRGKIILCLPFSKKVPDKLESTLVAGVDLGLKDGMVISVYDIYSEREKKRIFMDQQEIAGKKGEWFLKKPFSSGKQKFPNLKNKLFKLRHEIKLIQSERMQLENNGQSNSHHHWLLETEEKMRWKKIRGIHKEMVNQYATRLVAYCLYYKIGFIAFENLKWSTHSLKEKVGSFLAHWQIHWFFAQIQERAEQLALSNGIGVTRVNPKNTSQKCHRCNKKGQRNRKRFHCKKCDWKGDSDLNAARNIAKRGIPRAMRYLKTNTGNYMFPVMVPVGYGVICASLLMW